jgi:hypothetical protein
MERPITRFLLNRLMDAHAVVLVTACAAVLVMGGYSWLHHRPVHAQTAVNFPVLVGNCSSSASPAVCASANAGTVAVPTGTVSVALTVNTTAVTANSQIFLMSDDSLGTKLGVTCNSTLATLVGGLAITARTAGTSFTMTYNGTIATNPLCVSYQIIN